jgi:hypothetical protein
MRHSLLNNNSTKSDTILLLSKERKIEDSKTPKHILVDYLLINGQLFQIQKYLLLFQDWFTIHSIN